MSRRMFLACGLAPLGALLSRAVGDTPDAIQVIVHPDNRATAISAAVLRDAYLKRTAEWAGGRVIRPVDLPIRSAAYEQFARRILRKTPTQLRYYWNQRVYSGKGTPPPQVASPAAAVAYVLEHEAAIAYLPAGTDAGAARVIEVR